MGFKELWKLYEGQVDFLSRYELTNVRMIKEVIGAHGRFSKVNRFKFENDDGVLEIDLKCHYHSEREKDYLIKCDVVHSSSVIGDEKNNINKLLFDFLNENY